MFRHYRVILRELVISTLPSYNSMSNAQLLHLTYLFNLARYWLQAVWGWHDSVETCSSVIICEIIVSLLVIVENKKLKTLFLNVIKVEVNSNSNNRNGENSSNTNS